MHFGLDRAVDAPRDRQIRVNFAEGSFEIVATRNATAEWEVRGGGVWPGTGMTMTCVVEAVVGDYPYASSVGDEFAATIGETLVNTSDESVPLQTSAKRPQSLDEACWLGTEVSLERSLEIDGTTYFPMK